MEAGGKEKRRPFSILFRGCSFMLVYEAGVWAALQELSPDILKAASKIYGASSGSIVATLGLCGCDADELKQIFQDIVSRSYLPFIVGGKAMRLLQECLNKHLPPNAHQLVSGKLHIILTRLRDWRCVLVSDFASREDLIQAISCSCFIPVYFGFVPPTYQGVHYVDGELGMWRASFVSRSTITISAFAGEYDICPRESPAAFLTFQISDCILQISKSNFRRLLHIFQLPSCQRLEEIYAHGYQDTLSYLQRLGMFGVNYLEEDFVLSLTKGSSPKPETRLLHFRATGPEDVTKGNLESTRAADGVEEEASQHLLHPQKAGMWNTRDPSASQREVSAPSGSQRSTQWHAAFPALLLLFLLFLLLHLSPLQVPLSLGAVLQLCHPSGGFSGVE
ncbi:omega-hydroxyceramide transacylase-like isoform X2 [Melanerpes formicivorus]|uniref:omega-hydroxyceramide transacylase-like isoform X2 n=1 Tax=Melanerpes formicivorus TaxID=211600 RepID=UPI00358E0A5C